MKLSLLLRELNVVAVLAANAKNAMLADNGKSAAQRLALGVLTQLVSRDFPHSYMGCVVTVLCCC